MSRIYHQLRSSKTRGPDVATGISRSIFMSCHDNARGVMFDSDLESRADLIKWKGTAYTTNVTLPPPPAQKCLKTSDHLMYNLNNLTRGAPTQEASPPETQPPTGHPAPYKKTLKKITCLYKNIYYTRTITTKPPSRLKSAALSVG